MFSQEELKDIGSSSGGPGQLRKKNTHNSQGHGLSSRSRISNKIPLESTKANEWGINEQDESQYFDGNNELISDNNSILEKNDKVGGFENIGRDI